MCRTQCERILRRKGLYTVVYRLYALCSIARLYYARAVMKLPRPDPRPGPCRGSARNLSRKMQPKRKRQVKARPTTTTPEHSDGTALLVFSTVHTIKAEVVW